LDPPNKPVPSLSYFLKVFRLTYWKTYFKKKFQGQKPKTVIKYLVIKDILVDLSHGQCSRQSNRFAPQNILPRSQAPFLFGQGIDGHFF